MKDKSLPKKKELMDAILTVMDTVDETIITSYMNDAVANLLKIPTDLLQIEEQNGTGTESGYRMRWTRTELKRNGHIDNPERGYWKLVKRA